MALEDTSESVADGEPTAPEWLQEAFDTAHEELEEEEDKPLSGREINDGLCRAFARAVLKHVTDEHLDVRSWGYQHTWFEYEGAYYDAERRIYGATSLAHLPIFNHPDQAVPDEVDVIDGFPDGSA